MQFRVLNNFNAHISGGQRITPSLGNWRLNPPSRDGKRKTNLHKFMDGKTLKNWFVIDAARCRDYGKFIEVHRYIHIHVYTHN